MADVSEQSHVRGHHLATLRGKRIAWVSGTGVLWVVLTWVFWTGYAGADDLSYARYAYLFHRAPHDWWEFRLPAILAMRVSFSLFGPSEFAATVPTLVSSLAILGSVAWFVDWPRTLNWQTQSAVVLATLMPIDVAFRSYPAAPFIAAGFVAVGTVAILKGSARIGYAGAALLAVGFLTHEMTVFYIAIFCASALVIEPRRLRRQVFVCVALSAAFISAEMLLYAIWLDDPLARFKSAAHMTTFTSDGVDPEGLLTDSQFFLWPVRNLIYCKQFGFTLGAVFALGLFAWRRLSESHRVLLATTFLVWLWLGYGSQVPWAYRPTYRQFHFYSPLVVGTSVLLPMLLGVVLAARQRVAQLVALSAAILHVFSLSAGGRWGAAVDVSRELLLYAKQNPDRRYVTDSWTLNHMYVLNGFDFPGNVVGLHRTNPTPQLIVNWEPPGVPRFQFPVVPVDGVLVNREQEAQQRFEAEFTDYLRRTDAPTRVIEEPRKRLLFRPFEGVLPSRDFMLQSVGAELGEFPAGAYDNR